MPSATMEKAQAAESAAWAAASSVSRPDDIAALEAVELYRIFDRIGRAAGAAKLLLAKRVDASGEAARRGFGSTADLLASLSGGSIGAAKGELQASAALTGLPETKRALLSGNLSPARCLGGPAGPRRG